MTTDTVALDRDRLADRYRRIRRRSRQLFDIVRPEAYRARPIALRHPIVFYEGHLPAFSLNTLVKKALGRPGVDAGLERLFAASTRTARPPATAASRPDGHRAPRSPCGNSPGATSAPDPGPRQTARR